MLQILKTLNILSGDLEFKTILADVVKTRQHEPLELENDDVA
jgi:hypothetical protein